MLDPFKNISLIKIKKAAIFSILTLGTAFNAIAKDESGYVNMPASLGIFTAASNPWVKGVQYGSITIGALSNSNTATITSVDTSKAWVIFDGFTCSTTTNTSLVLSPRIELTNGTTVTATRSSALDVGTVTVYFSVIEGTSRFIDTIQSGTISTSASSGTATITSVDLTRSAVFYLGCTSANATGAVARMFAVTLTNATTVTANSNSSPTTGVIGFVVVQWKASAIQSIQQVSDAYTTANITDTKAISAVTLANTMIAWGGFNTGGTGTYTIGPSSTTNINLVRLSTSTSSRTPRYTVIQFVPSVIKSIQRGVISLASATSNTATVSSVSTSKSLCNFVGYQMTSTDTPNLLFSGVTLTNATTVTGFVNSNSASSKSVGYEIVEFN